MDFKDYYQTLGVARDASADDIKKAFRKLARKYHPDVSKEPGAEARMKEINEANAVLSDPEKRALYDQMGSAHQPGQPFQPSPGWDSNFEFSGADAADSSDFFASLFGRAGGARRSGAYRMRGEDHHARVDIELQDAYQGARRTISLRRPRVAGCLRLGAKVLGPPAWNPDFNSADLPMLLRLADVPSRYRHHLLGA
mgnify:CR=1 FL=1